MAENKAFESIMKGLSESLEYAKGDNSKARRMCVTVAELPKFHDKEIKQIRENLNLTQKILHMCWVFRPKLWKRGNQAGIFRKE